MSMSPPNAIIFPKFNNFLANGNNNYSFLPYNDKYYKIGVVYILYNTFNCGGLKMFQKHKFKKQCDLEKKKNHAALT